MSVSTRSIPIGPPGVGILAGAGDHSPVVRTYLAGHPDAAKVRPTVRLCASCAARAMCARYGHVYTDPRRGGGEDGTGGWRACACDRRIREHADTHPDPAGGPGCGMQYRLCARCDHIDERHITDHPAADPDAAVGGDGWVCEPTSEPTEVQPGGHLRQDVPAGLALPTTQQSGQGETAW
jgi:hypothetical protein